MNGGPGGRARSPVGSGSGTLLEGGQPPTSWAWAAGMQGTPAGVGPSGVRTAGLPRWQLPGVRAEALLPLAAGPGAPFPRPGRAEPGSRPPVGAGVTRALPGPPHPRHYEWTGSARPGRKRAPPARPAKRVGTWPGTAPAPRAPSPLPGAGEGGPGSALALGRPRIFRDLSPDDGS